MSSILKVTVEHESTGRHVLLFNGDINDTYEWGEIGDDGEREFDLNYPVTSCMMYYQFQESRVAIDARISWRKIEFTLPRGSFLDEVIAGLLDLLIENIGPRTFLVYMPR